MTLDHGEVTIRKGRHIDVCRDEAIGYHGVTTGLERHRLPNSALTQTNLEDIDLATDFLGGN